MEKKGVKMIIFDMDGVIVDSEPFHENARQMMFQKYHVVPDERFPEALGRSTRGFWRRVLQICGMEGDPAIFEKEHFSLVAKQVEENSTPATDGLLEVLAWAKEQGIKIGLASSSTRYLVDAVLRFLKIEDVFDYTVSGDEVEKKKPAPDVYERVLQMAGIPAEYAAAVEDSHAGVSAAKNAGLYCFGYVNEASAGQDLSAADVIMSNLKEIIKESRRNFA